MRKPRVRSAVRACWRVIDAREQAPDLQVQVAGARFQARIRYGAFGNHLVRRVHGGSEVVQHGDDGFTVLVRQPLHKLGHDDGQEFRDGVHASQHLEEIFVGQSGLPEHVEVDGDVAELPPCLGRLRGFRLARLVAAAFGRRRFAGVQQPHHVLHAP